MKSQIKKYLSEIGHRGGSKRTEAQKKAAAANLAKGPAARWKKTQEDGPWKQAH